MDAKGAQALRAYIAEREQERERAGQPDEQPADLAQAENAPSVETSDSASRIMLWLE